LQSFLGFVNYVHRFVPDMARLTAPLTDLLRKGVAFTWGEKEHAAFSALKNVLCSSPVLRIADPHRPFEVVTDASDIANGLQPITYESQKLHSSENNYPIHDREMLAIVHAFKVWRCYLTGADVTVRTDHKSLQYLRAQPHLNPRQFRWLDFLESNFHYTVTYKKGVSNIADALTCPTAQIHAILLTQTTPLCVWSCWLHGVHPPSTSPISPNPPFTPLSIPTATPTSPPHPPPPPHSGMCSSGRERRRGGSRSLTPATPIPSPPLLHPQKGDGGEGGGWGAV
ncbi:unnamed protein product, partial [Closterium sp. NIES-53]